MMRRTIELTQEQKDIVLAKLSDVQGCFDEYIEVADNMTVRAWGILDIEGYRENDYFNGTGAFVETSRVANVTLSVLIVDENGYEEECDLTDEFDLECYNLLQEV